jgi:hypothetical protein
MASAARSHVGAQGVTNITKWRDILIVIVVPFIVPAAVLALVRSSQSSPFFTSFTLGDVAFGFVAMAIAGVARAATVKSDEWMAFAGAVLIVIIFQTALAIKVDDVADTRNLLHEVASTSQAKVVHDLPDLKELEASIQNKEPTLFFWTVSLATGSIIAVGSFVLIRREK